MATSLPPLPRLLACLPCLLRAWLAAVVYYRSFEVCDASYASQPALFVSLLERSYLGAGA